MLAGDRSLAAVSLELEARKLGMILLRVSGNSEIFSDLILFETLFLFLAWKTHFKCRFKISLKLSLRGDCISYFRFGASLQMH